MNYSTSVRVKQVLTLTWYNGFAFVYYTACVIEIGHNLALVSMKNSRKTLKREDKDVRYIGFKSHR